MTFLLPPADDASTRERSFSHQPVGTLGPSERKELEQALFEGPLGRERATSLITPKEKYPNWKKRTSDIPPRKSSSTATLFIDSTISAPKHAELIRW